MSEETDPQPAAAPPAKGRGRIRLALLPIALAFVGWTLWDMTRHWDGTVPTPRWGLVALSTLPLAAGVLIQAVAWRVLLSRMTGRPIPFKPAIVLHVDSMLARYTPGKVGLPLVRMAGAGSVGVKPATVAVSVGLEMLSFTALGGLIGFGLLAVSGTAETTRRLAALSSWSWPFLAGFALITVVLLTVDRRRFPARALALLRIDGEGPLVPAALPVFHVAYWGTWALHGYLMTLSVGALPSVAFASSGLYVLAVVIGFLAMVAPAGAGVREAVISLGVTPAVGASATLAVVLVSRITTVVVELVVWAGTRLVARQLGMSRSR